MRKFASLIVFALGFASCNPITPPNKIHGIPSNAFWVGGSDGGAWLLIDSTNSMDQSIYCKVYNDNTGELLDDKKWLLHCSGQSDSVDWNSLEGEIYGFDGQIIILKALGKNERNCFFK